ncbi:TraR/DksA family transcriptional regulator [Pseudorhodoferax sp.]|uniref:TraR/DksA family transcriptional regulator n=1 Tax=Pseudorhodoferax sp. TaxID=1993553 RepID=UPI002DD6AAEA|nr:TraR/DksA family transcriptional regulator [Pseudorhodoferax sp.]
MALDRSVYDALRERLDARAATLGSEVALLRGEEAGAPGKAPGGEPEDAAERGEEDTRNAVRNVELLRDTQELRDIGAALQRLDEGQYGHCVACGSDIPLARLQVQPAAARCIACQKQFERSTPPLPQAPPPSG